MAEIDEDELKKFFCEMKLDNKSIFEEFYSKYKKLVYGIAFSILKNKEDSEDITQIVFSKIYSLNTEKLPTKNYASWLYSLTKNETISYLRKKNNNINLDNIYDIKDYNNDIDNVIDEIEFNRLISKLNDTEKQIVTLKIIGDFSFDEIGKFLNLPSGTVKWKYYKSINSLKVLLGNLGMFIITFIIGVRTLFNTNRVSNISKETVLDQEVLNENNENQTRVDINKSDTTINENILQEEFNSLEDSSSVAVEQNIEENLVIENTETENIEQNVVEEIKVIQDYKIKEDNINFLGVGFLGISAVFLILTIIYFIKIQLKRKKKASKQ